MQRTPSPVIGELIRAMQRRKSEGMKMIMQRQDEFPDRLSALLTGIALDPEAREFADSFLSSRFRDSSFFPFEGINTPELIIGSGFHAAVYASTRVAAGFPAPVIVEQSDRVGGTFAIGNGRPVFYLNSRTRKGDAGLAGDDSANLNYLPGAPIQSSSVGNGSYQTNADMGFTIRLALAQTRSKILTSQAVTSVESSFSNGYDVTLDNGNVIRACRIIDARGLGAPKSAAMVDGRTVLTFPQFMARMSDVWPLRGIQRAAVIGTGDSARCAVESLLGLSPQPFMAAAELDTVSRIDWYGEGIGPDFDTFCRSERGRYRPIARFLKPDAYGNKRLNVFSTRAFPMPLAGGKALVNGRSYDIVITCTGNEEIIIAGLGDTSDYETYAPDVKGGSRFRDRQDPIARRYYGERSESQGRFRIGPHAQLDFTSKEIDAGIGRIPNNRVAMFRLATKTATLASTLEAAAMPY